MEIASKCLKLFPIGGYLVVDANGDADLDDKRTSSASTVSRFASAVIVSD